jgi:hypothetical protein
MADQVFMYGIVTGVFAVLTGILFSSSKKKVGRAEIYFSCFYVWREERCNLEETFIILRSINIHNAFLLSEHEDSNISPDGIVKNSNS